MEIIDYLLARKKAGGGSDVTIEQLTATENGTYSEEGIAYSPVVVNVPAPENSYQLKDLPTGTVSTIEDGTDLPMSSLKVGIEPVQDLHGYDHPWAGGAGKNKCDAQNPIVLSQADNIGNQPCTIPAGTYTYSWTSSENTAISLTLWNDSTQIGSFASTTAVQGRGNITFTISENATHLRCYYNGATTVSDIQVESGSEATSYSPYSNICPISGWTEANVTRSGKNLFDKVNCGVYNGYISGTKVYDSSNHKTIYIPCKPNTTYSCKNFSGNNRAALSYSSEIPSASTDIGYAMDGIITTDANAKYLLCYCYNANSDTVTFDDVKNALDIELGSVAPTSYSPYNGTTYTIQFKDGDNPLTVYGGTLDVTSGELVVDRVFLTNDYLVNTADYEPAGRNCYVLIGITLKTSGSSVIDNKLIASALQTSTQDDLYTNSKIGIAHWWNTRIAFSTGDSSITSKSAFKEWLARNGSDVCYELATPITYQLTPTQVRTLVGNNNIWADTGNIIEGKYFKSLS